MINRGANKENENIKMEIDLTTQVAEAADVDLNLASRVIPMFEEGFTVPFIARYRKEITGGAEPPVLQRLKEKMNECKILIEKIDKSFQFLSKSGLMTETLSKELKKCKTVEDVKLITEPFKPKGPRTLAGRAKAVKLEAVALQVLNSGKHVDMFGLAPPEARKIFQTKLDIENAVSHIIADIFAKDLDIIRKAEELCSKFSPFIVTNKKSGTISKQSTSNPKPEPMIIDDNGNGLDFLYNDDDNDDDAGGKLSKTFTKSSKNNNDLITFKNYLNFSRPIAHLQAHQILAINRAVDRGVISIKINFSNQIERQCGDFVACKYFHSVHPSHIRFVKLAFSDAWKRLIEPHLSRSLRVRLTTSAQDTSLEVFTENLRRLLMTAPLRASFPVSNSDHLSSMGVVSSASAAPGDRLPVVGLDPGWRHGCKWAACDPHGDVLATGIIWPPHLSSFKPDKANKSSNGLADLTAVMQRHNITILALGNGQGSRPTGSWFSHLIEIGHFHPLNVRYAVVSEAGASYYSASPLACKELSNLDVSFRGAVSIARRLQDPLAELVKLEPKHLGVGMYQHDLPEKRLISAVNNVMEECISFVGVDINAAPLHILSRVAGLSEAKAKSIIAYRAQIGAFRSRSELLKVKGIGKATFGQCAGFVRVKPTYSPIMSDGTKDVEMISISSDDDENEDLQFVSVSCLGGKRKRSTESFKLNLKTKKFKLNQSTTDQLPKNQIDNIVHTFNPLDQTAVHPDSYQIATNLIVSLHCTLTDVGSEKLRQAAKKLGTSSERDKRLKLFCTEHIGLDTMRDILEALSRPLDFDERQDCFTPLFHSSIMKISDLRQGMRVSGRVENVTTFGAFCDIGVEQDAYIPRHAYPQSNVIGNISKHSFTLHVGDRITATVLKVDVKHGRISLDQVVLIK